MPDFFGRLSAGECLDPERLSAYVDGKLDARERAEVEAHLASCSDCYEVMNEVLRIQEAIAMPDVSAVPVRRPGGVTVVRGAFGRRKAVWRVAGVLLAAAAALVLVVRLQPTWWTGVDPKLADLVEAVGEERTVEARLTGGFKYGPLRSPVRSGGRAGPTDNWSLLAAAGKIREVAERNPTPESLHALGVAQLQLGEYDDAVAALEKALAQETRDPRILNDLAAAYYARGVAVDRREDLARGLDISEQLRASHPTLAEGAFAHALILQRMGQLDRARQAWRDYLSLDPKSPWAAEAAANIAEIDAAGAKGLHG